MLLGIAEIQGVHDHADVGGVLARLAHVGDLNEFKGGLVQIPLELLVAVEITISLLDDDMSFEQEAFEHLLNVEAGVMGITGSESNVLQIEEHRHGRV